MRISDLFLTDVIIYLPVRTVCVSHPAWFSCHMASIRCGQSHAAICLNATQRSAEAAQCTPQRAAVYNRSYDGRLRADVNLQFSSVRCDSIVAAKIFVVLFWFGAASGRVGP